MIIETLGDAYTHSIGCTLACAEGQGIGHEEACGMHLPLRSRHDDVGGDARPRLPHGAPRRAPALPSLRQPQGEGHVEIPSNVDQGKVSLGRVL